MAFPPWDENALGTISADGLEALSIAAVWGLAAVPLFALFSKSCRLLVRAVYMELELDSLCPTVDQ